VQREHLLRLGFATAALRRVKIDLGQRASEMRPYTP
jgi:hypothetical protein